MSAKAEAQAISLAGLLKGDGWGEFSEGLVFIE